MTEIREIPQKDEGRSVNAGMTAFLDAMHVLF
jgi:hypothetical protein